MSKRSGLKRLLGFGITPVISALGPVFLLPLLTRAAGAEGWAALATGQAIGIVVGTLALYSWQVHGAPHAATLSDRAARQFLHLSILLRGSMAVTFAPVALLATALIVPGSSFRDAALLSLSSLLSTSLTNSWYFVGRGDPGRYFLLETLPRSTAVVISAMLLAVGFAPFSYAVTTLSAEILIISLATFLQARKFGTGRETVGASRQILRENARLTFSSLASLGYTRAAVPIVAAIHFSASASFAAADRMQNISRTVIRPLTQAFQAWVYASLEDADAFKKRAFTATLTVGSAGLLIGGALAVALPTWGYLIFGSEISTDASISLPLGCAVFMIAISSSASTFYLAPLRQTRGISTSLLTTSVLGVPLIAFTAAVAAPQGPLVAIAVVEMVVAVWQSIAAKKAVSRWAQGGRRGNVT